jgi:hypothetical protein
MVAMTTIPQMESILDDLGIKNPDVIYYGWQPLGASEMPPRSLILDGKLGTLTQLRGLAEKVSANGGHFYLYLDPQAAFWEQGGYSPRNDLAMSITNANETGYNRNHVNYYRNLQALEEFYSGLSRDVFLDPHLGLALDGISSSLYSDFKPGHVLSREDAINAYRDMLAANNGQTAFYMPNDYMFDFLSAYYDMPLTDSGYIYTSETVPFLQIVLAGYVPYYGKALNFSSNLQDDLLRHADFGMYPSYFVTHEVTAKLLKTNSNWIYTSAYAQWKKEIQKTYQWLDSLLAPVKGQEIIARRALADGVIVTTYANGNQIIVNYNNWPYSANGTTVEAKDAILRGVQP